MKILGAVAQLGERLHGMQEVRGSIPRSSTIVTKRLFLGSIQKQPFLFRNYPVAPHMRERGLRSVLIRT